jgi:hypothetical protein
MTDQRRSDRDRRHPEEPPTKRRQDEPPRDPGAYIGRLPERAAATIPGGVSRRDVRVSAVGTRPAPASGSTTADSPPTPDGHREAGQATDDTVREAGQNR